MLTVFQRVNYSIMTKPYHSIPRRLNLRPLRPPIPLLLPHLFLLLPLPPLPLAVTMQS